MLSLISTMCRCTALFAMVAVFTSGMTADDGAYSVEPSPGRVLASGQASDTTVTIDSGVIDGAVSEGILSFKGVPFAAPPIGDLRWRAPQPVTPWTGVRRATEYGQDCLQVPLRTDAAAAGTTFSEDCLVLNVWRPAAIAAGERLPVMMWIHGGGYVNGGSSPAIYNGSEIARHGILFVSANYRLGRFGFFAHPALIAANEGPAGNFAYMDQIAALQWVKRNAAAFGGDAAQVTVVGESAGGDALMHLITSPEGRGLFHRAVVMSGDGRSHLIGGLPLTGGTTHKPSADQVGINFAASVGIDGDGPDTLRALRALTAEQVRGDVNVLYLLNRLRPGSGPLTYANGTIVDGHIVLDSPGEMLQRGEAVRVPIMIGTTANDLPIRLPPLIDPLSYFGEEAPRARALYDPEATVTSPQLIFTIGADITMHEPARFVAQQMTASGSPTWLFRFDYVAESLRATTRHAAHASEIPFFFDTIDARYGSHVTAADRAAARLLSTYLVNFVKSGDPNGRGVPAWPRVDRSRPTLMLFTSDRGPVFGRDPWAERLDLVERAAQRRSTNESHQ